MKYQLYRFKQNVKLVANNWSKYACAFGFFPGLKLLYPSDCDNIRVSFPSRYQAIVRRCACGQVLATIKSLKKFLSDQ